MVIVAICVAIAMYCLIQFHIQLREDLAEHSPFLKLLSIKLVIFLSFWQTVRYTSVSLKWVLYANIAQDPYVIPNLIWRYQIYRDDKHTGYENWNP